MLGLLFLDAASFRAERLELSSSSAMRDWNG